MTKEELTEWFNNEFWEQYRELIQTPFATKYKIGPKGDSLKIMIRLAPSKNLRARILSAICEQKKHRKLMFEQCGSMQKYVEKTKFDTFYATRMCRTWLGQMGWEDEIPPLDILVSGRIDLLDGIRCHTDDCMYPVHGPGYEYCVECLTRTPEHNDMLKNKLREMGLGKSKDESLHEYAMRCKAKALNIFKALNERL